MFLILMRVEIGSRILQNSRLGFLEKRNSLIRGNAAVNVKIAVVCKKSNVGFSTCRYTAYHGYTFSKLLTSSKSN